MNPICTPIVDQTFYILTTWPQIKKMKHLKKKTSAVIMAFKASLKIWLLKRTHLQTQEAKNNEVLMFQRINYEQTINMQLKTNIRSGSVDEMGTPPQIWFVVQSHVGGIPHWTRLVEMSILVGAWFARNNFEHLAEWRPKLHQKANCGWSGCSVIEATNVATISITRPAKKLPIL